jgi:proteic killer suppression protein
MIRSWANSATRRLHEESRSRKFRGLDLDAALELLAILDAATSLRDLSPLRSVGLHKLKGDRKGQWAMTVNGPWRICFRFERGNAHDVEVIDYHRG